MIHLFAVSLLPVQGSAFRVFPRVDFRPLQSNPLRIILRNCLAVCD